MGPNTLFVAPCSLLLLYQVMFRFHVRSSPLWFPFLATETKNTRVIIPSWYFFILFVNGQYEFLPAEMPWTEDFLLHFYIDVHITDTDVKLLLIGTFHHVVRFLVNFNLPTLQFFIKAVLCHYIYYNLHYASLNN